MPIAAVTSSTAFWYLTRATGVIALILLTLVVALGVVDVVRLSSPRWPRFLTDAVHRYMSLLAVAFVGVHVVSTLLDTYAPIGLFDVVIPFHSAYRPLWLGLGATAFDLLLAVIVTSVLRTRIGAGGWRAVHWLAYACWPVAVVHGLGTGTDVKQTWMLVIDAVCVATVVASVGVRLASTSGLTPGARAAGITLPALFVIGLLVWLPGGPLAGGWARRAGTPVKLLHGATAAATGSTATTAARTR